MRWKCAVRRAQYGGGSLRFWWAEDTSDANECSDSLFLTHCPLEVPPPSRCHRPPAVQYGWNTQYNRERQWKSMVAPPLDTPSAQFSYKRLRRRDASLRCCTERNYVCAIRKPCAKNIDIRHSIFGIRNVLIIVHHSTDIFIIIHHTIDSHQFLTKN